MVQMVATLISLLAGLSALAVIGFSLAEDWGALTRALGAANPSSTPPLPPRTRQVAPARRARMVRITLPEEWSRRAA